MGGIGRKNLRQPDESIELAGATEDLVEIGDVTVGRVVHPPGWRWSTHAKPLVGGDWCQARHVGVVISGRLAAVLPDGTEVELGPEDVYDIPPAHDGYVVGDEPCVLIEWAGLRTFVGGRAGFRGRTLATLLFTDLVDSTSTAVRLGDVAWRETVSLHYQAVRAELERFGGREVATRGDGILAIFDGPAAAVRCAAAICEHAAAGTLGVRIGVHVGEVELAGAEIHGVAVHEAARIMGEAGANEVLVSEITRGLAAASGLRFTDRGEHVLKGLDGAWRLYAYEPTAGGEA